MPMCFAFGCNHQLLRDRCRFFRFPKDQARKWEKLCRRKDRQLNIDNDRICSCHFKDHNKSNGPTIFSWNAEKYLDFPTPGLRKRKKLADETVVASTSEVPPEQISISTEDNSSPEKHLPQLALNDHSYAMTYEAVAESRESLLAQVRRLEEKVNGLTLDRSKAFTLQDIDNCEKKMLMYTSLKPDVFKVLDELLQRFKLTYVDGWTPTLCRSDQLLLTLMKLNMNTPLLDLAQRFELSSTAVNNIFITHVCALHEILCVGLFGSKIPTLQKCKASMPASFSDFSSCRLVIDATEISQDVPGKDMKLQAQTYSSYKSNHTVKSVTGVAPNGSIVFASKLYPGSTSDVAIVKHCQLLDKLTPGDMILADKGFTIHKILPPGVHLNIPPFLIGKSQYTPAEVQLCRKIGRSRIHVERANERIKNYSILQHIPQQYRFLSTKIFQLCCMLVNLQDPLLKEVASNYEVDNRV